MQEEVDNDDQVLLELFFYGWKIKLIYANNRGVEGRPYRVRKTFFVASVTIKGAIRVANYPHN